MRKEREREREREREGEREREKEITTAMGNGYTSKHKQNSSVTSRSCLERFVAKLSECSITFLCHMW